LGDDVEEGAQVGFVVVHGVVQVDRLHLLAPVEQVFHRLLGWQAVNVNVNVIVIVIVNKNGN